MRLPVRMNIENRIFYPFLLIFLLFTALFGSVLYYNSYRSLLGQQTAVADLTLETITGEIREYGESSGREGILNACRRRGDVSLVIRDEAGVLLLGPESGAMESPWELSSRRDNPFGWKLSYVIDRSNFYDSLIDAQKYLLLATVALLVVTVQASVFVAANISEPIRRFSAVCAEVSREPQRAGQDELLGYYIHRGDEIGELSQAFGRMLSDLRRHTDEILRVKQLNESIVENLPIGVAAFDAAGEQLCINSKAKALLEPGVWRSEAGEALSALLTSWLASGRLLVDPIRIQDAAGRSVDLEVGLWRLTDAGGFEWGALCTLDDVTYKKMMEEKYSESEKLAYTGQLAADLAHEIRNPLAGIRASIQVIARRLSGEGDRALCSSIVGEVDRINLLIENLLNLARQRVSHKTSFPAARLFDEISLLYTKVAENSRIVLSIAAEEGLVLYADEAEIKQVLINLINNSFKAIGSGGSVRVAAGRRENGLALTVSDDGAGMTPEEIRSLLSERGRQTPGGRGRGLMIVSRLLAQNGGSFSIESEAGRGTVITILFERELPDEV